MSETNMNSFIAGCSSLACTSIVTPLVEHVKAKKCSAQCKCDVSVEEFLEVLKLPKKVNGTVPPIAYGVPKNEVAKKASTQASVETLTPGFCSYMFKRGEGKKGKYCPNPAVQGSDRCANCLKSRNVNKTKDKVEKEVDVKSNDKPIDAYQLFPNDPTIVVESATGFKFVFHHPTQTVIGREGENKKIEPLSDQEREIATGKGFNVAPPTTSTPTPGTN
jgi:hypothetical protein